MTDSSLPPLATSILNFWFGAEPLTPATAERQKALWWSGSKNVDFDIERRFGKLVGLAGSGIFDAWMDSPKTSVALLLLLDQFPRNIFRGKADAFAFDAAALVCADRLVTSASFAELNPLLRSFSLLPLEHSESLQDQQRCLNEFERLIEESDASWHALLRGYRDYAEKHYRIIEQFGRFPHRNAALGRVSTPDELTYLESNASRFGQ